MLPSTLHLLVPNFPAHVQQPAGLDPLLSTVAASRLLRSFNPFHLASTHNGQIPKDRTDHFRTKSIGIHLRHHEPAPLPTPSTMAHTITTWHRRCLQRKGGAMSVDRRRLVSDMDMGEMCGTQTCDACLLRLRLLASRDRTAIKWGAGYDEWRQAVAIVVTVKECKWTSYRTRLVAIIFAKALRLRQVHLQQPLPLRARRRSILGMKRGSGKVGRSSEAVVVYL